MIPRTVATAWLVMILGSLAAGTGAGAARPGPGGGEERRLAWLCWSEGRESEALARLEELAARYGDDVDVLADLAAVLATGRANEVADAERAINVALSALALEDSHVRARLALAEAHYRKGEAGRAVSELVPLLVQRRLEARSLARLHFFAAAHRATLGRPEDVALRADSLFISGLALEQMGRLPDAEGLLRESLDLVPGRPPVILALVRLRRRAGKPTELDSLLENQEPIGLLRAERGREWLAGNRPAEAESSFRQALAEGADPGPVRAWLAFALEQEGRIDEALVEVRQARSLLGSDQTGEIDPREVDRLSSRLLEADGRHEEALEILLQALVAGDDSPATAEMIERLQVRIFGRSNDRRRLAASRWPEAVIFTPRGVAAAAGGRCTVLDLGGDDRLDMLIDGAGLFRARPGWRWVPQAGPPDPGELEGTRVVDLDGDGRLDLVHLAPRGARFWPNRGSRFGRRAIDLRWADSTEPRPLAAAAFGDLDLDGQLDAILIEQGAGSAGHHYLRSVAEAGSRAPRLHAPQAIHWAVIGDPLLVDLDDDGRLDLVAPSILGGGLLMPLDRDLEFAAARPVLSGEVPSFLQAHPVPAGRFLPADLNGDGTTDLLEVGGPSDRAVRILFNQAAAGTGFMAAALEVGGQRLTGVADATAGDVDNDGRLDLVILEATGRVRLLIPADRSGWRDVTWFAGLETTRARSVALADMDGDGALDLVLDGGRILQNSGNDRDWISLRLEGRGSAAVGARVTIQSGPTSQQRDVGLFSVNPATSTVHVGLGRVSGPVRAAIHWSDGRDQFLRSLKPRRHHLVKEPRR